MKTHFLRVALSIAARLGAGTIIAVFILLMHSHSAFAAKLYQVSSDSHPYRGPGIWVTNAPDGYYLGQIYSNDYVHPNKIAYSCQDGDRKKCQRWVYGYVESYSYNGTKRSIPLRYCGWVRGSDLVQTNSADNVPDSTCGNSVNALSDRGHVGINFNCAPHACKDGTRNRSVVNPGGTYVSKGCNGYYNVLHGRDGKYAGYDRSGPVTGLIHYRFQTTDGSFAAVRSSTMGWLFVDSSCVKGTRTGGPANSQCREILPTTVGVLAETAHPPQCRNKR